MRHLIYLTVICLFSISCGSHRQELFRVDSLSPAKNIVEKNSLLRLEGSINRGDIKEVKEALESGIDVNSVNRQGLTLLMIATRSQQFAVMEYLMIKGANPDLKNEMDESRPLKRAIDYVSGNEQTMDILRTILKSEAFDLSQINKSIYEAIKKMNVGIVRWLLLNKGADPNSIRKTGSGREKDSPLIYLLSLRGVEGDSFNRLSQIFDLLISHSNIKINLRVRNRTALGKLNRVNGRNELYDEIRVKLISMGAIE